MEEKYAQFADDTDNKDLPQTAFEAGVRGTRLEWITIATERSRLSSGPSPFLALFFFFRWGGTYVKRWAFQAYWRVGEEVLRDFGDPGWDLNDFQCRMTVLHSQSPHPYQKGEESMVMFMCTLQRGRFGGEQDPITEAFFRQT
jgi:hypothetical protein